MTNMSNTTTVRFHMGGESDIKTAHNRRDEATVKWEKHIDMERKHIVLKDMELEEAYAELFGEAIEEYDAKQKRRDRKIGGVREYMEQVRADARGRVNKKTREKGKNLAYEVIVGIGSVKPVVDESTGRYKRDEDGEILMPFLVPDDICEEALKAYLDAWEKRNPHLYVYGAYYHADEGGAPHMHIDFIPWADGYKRGMEVQTSLNKALEQQGCISEGWTRNSSVVWADRERQFLEDIVSQYGYEVVHPDAGKYREAVPWRMYAEEQEALRQLDEQYAALESMRREEADMEAELSIKKQELESVSEELSLIEEMRNTVLPDGRTALEHIIARARKEKERKRLEEEERNRIARNRRKYEYTPARLNSRAVEELEAEEERIQRKAREDAAGLGEAKQMRYERFLRDHPGSVGMTRESGLDFDFGRFKR